MRACSLHSQPVCGLPRCEGCNDGFGALPVEKGQAGLAGQCGCHTRVRSGNYRLPDLVFARFSTQGHLKAVLVGPGFDIHSGCHDHICRKYNPCRGTFFLCTNHLVLPCCCPLTFVLYPYLLLSLAHALYRPYSESEPHLLPQHPLLRDPTLFLIILSFYPCHLCLGSPCH